MKKPWVIPAINSADLTDTEYTVRGGINPDGLIETTDEFDPETGKCETIEWGNPESQS
jgi:hypothetical protein